MRIGIGEAFILYHLLYQIARTNDEYVRTIAKVIKANKQGVHRLHH